MTEPSETNPIVAVRQYRWVVAASVVLVVIVGLVFTAIRQDTFIATAGLTLDDPANSDIFDNSRSGSIVRYIADQEAVLGSDVVAQRASDILRAENPGSALTAAKVLDQTAIRTEPETNFVTIRFTAGDPDLAQAGANAVAVAYQQVVREEAIAAGESVVARLDAAIDTLDAEATDLNNELDEYYDESFVAALERELDLVILTLGVGGPGVESTLASLDQIIQRLTAQRLIDELKAQDPTSIQLQQRLDEAARVREALKLRRSEIEVGVALSSSAVTLYSPAGPGSNRSISLFVTVALSLFIGLLVGAGAAYLLASRSHILHARVEPASILQAPLITEVPDFLDENVRGALPITEAPRSVAAEAFRFVATSLETLLVDGESAEGDESGAARWIAIVSGDLGDGKTTIAANTAIAAALHGNRVLVVDADLANRSLSWILDGETSPQPGLTDLAETQLPLWEFLQTIELESGVTLSLLRGGTSLTPPILFFQSNRAQALEEIAWEFDLVIVDTPPMLDVAYAGTIARFVDGIIVPVRHGTDANRLQELRDRLDLLDVTTIGYVYNRGPAPGTGAPPHASSETFSTVVQEMTEWLREVPGKARARFGRRSSDSSGADNGSDREDEEAPARKTAP